MTRRIATAFQQQSLALRAADTEGEGPQVAEWERELNALVYELYGLTEGEIGVVKGANLSGRGTLW